MESILSILSHFTQLRDFRDPCGLRHKFGDIIVITILAIICGADEFSDIENFGESKEDFLRSFLELPNGIPSHDTFGRIFSLLDPEVFRTCFGTRARCMG